MYTYKKNLNGVIKNRQGKNTTKYFMQSSNIFSARNEFYLVELLAKGEIWKL